MDNRTESDDSEFWLKYCEECVKSKIGIDVKSSSDSDDTNREDETL